MVTGDWQGVWGRIDLFSFLAEVRVESGALRKLDMYSATYLHPQPIGQDSNLGGLSLKFVPVALTRHWAGEPTGLAVLLTQESVSTSFPASAGFSAQGNRKLLLHLPAELLLAPLWRVCAHMCNLCLCVCVCTCVHLCGICSLCGCILEHE